MHFLFRSFLVLGFTTTAFAAAHTETTQFAPNTPFEIVAKKLRSISLDPRNSRFELYKTTNKQDDTIQISFTGFGSAKEFYSETAPSLICRFEIAGRWDVYNPVPASAIDQMFTRVDGKPIQSSDWYGGLNGHYVLEAAAVKAGVAFLVAGPAVFESYGPSASCAKWQEPTYQQGDEVVTCVEDGPMTGPAWSELRLPLEVKLADSVTLKNIQFICNSRGSSEITVDDVIHAPGQTFYLGF